MDRKSAVVNGFKAALEDYNMTTEQPREHTLSLLLDIWRFRNGERRAWIVGADGNDFRMSVYTVAVKRLDVSYVDGDRDDLVPTERPTDRDILTQLGYFSDQTNFCSLNLTDEQLRVVSEASSASPYGTFEELVTEALRVWMRCEAEAVR